jgi:hypothetical protein
MAPILLLAAAILQDRSPDIRIGNFLVGAPCGIAFVVRDRAAFVVDTGGPYVAGVAAPDDSYHRQVFQQKGAWITFEWGRVGDAAVARVTSDRPADVSLRFSAGWPDLHSDFRPTGYGAVGLASIDGDAVHWKLDISPAPVISSPVISSADPLVAPVEPGSPVRFVAGTGMRPAVASTDQILDAAKARYASSRPAASGVWGDFVGAIADNMNNSRIYSTDNHRLAHSVSRRWAGSNPNTDPYFCWDSFFTANLAAIDDPVTARGTVRAILSCQTKKGLVPNFAHWSVSGSPASNDRSQPPVGSLCVWRMHERRPDLDFLKEVYPKLLKWHDWWPKYRDGNHNGLLEWGSDTGAWQDAQYETGWDDNLHFAGTRMVGPHMNADAVDLTSMWSMDALYLSKIASAIGFKADALRLAAEHEATNRRIDALLWNPRLGIYCSRYWHPERVEPVPESAFGAGFQAGFYSDEHLMTEVARRRDRAIDFDWQGKAPVDGVPAVHWSARWTGAVKLTATGRYRISVAADDGVRVFVDGRRVINDWAVHPPVPRDIDIVLGRGKLIPIVVEYFQHEGGSSLHFSIARVAPGGLESAFLTRVTPMNFYPLLAGVPSGARASSVVRHLTDPHAFWGRNLIPTLSYNDPDYHQQQYWRGDVWGPVNYLLWQGIQRYATKAQQREYAERSVQLFMRSWKSNGICSENYYSNTGLPGGDPHYTWGALLCLVGLEYAEANPEPGIKLMHVR